MISLQTIVDGNFFKSEVRIYPDPHSGPHRHFGLPRPRNFRLEPSVVRVKARRCLDGRNGKDHAPAERPRAGLPNGTEYMSWNGATEVQTWNVYQASTANETALSLVGIAQNPGIETAVHLGSTGCFLVEPVVSAGSKSVNSSIVCSD